MTKKQKYIQVRKKCIQLGIPVPAEIEAVVSTAASKPPQDVIDAMIANAEKLSKGQKMKFPLHKWGLVVEALLHWEDDEYASVEFFGYKPLKKYTALEKFLLDQVDSWDVEAILCDEIRESPEFKRFQKEIQAVCDESIKLEKQYADFDWYTDVAEPAGIA